MAEAAAVGAADSGYAASAEPDELRALRRQIDALDRQIVALLNERARLGLAVGRAKLAAGRRRIRDADRESEVLARVAEISSGPLPEKDLVALYRRLVRATRDLELRERAASRAARHSDEDR